MKEELKLIGDLEELVGFKDGEIDELLTDDSLIDDIEIIILNYPGYWRGGY